MYCIMYRSIFVKIMTANMFEGIKNDNCITIYSSFKSINHLLKLNYSSVYTLIYVCIMYNVYAALIVDKMFIVLLYIVAILTLLI